MKHDLVHNFFHCAGKVCHFFGMAVCNPMLVAKVIYSKIPISIQKPAPYGHLTLIWFGGICTELPGHTAKVITKSAMLIVGWQEACFGFSCV